MQSIGESFRNHRLYTDFIQVKSRLQKSDFVCWLAGGAVRDLLLGVETSDLDLVTDASTENLKQLFPEALLVGEKFGVLKLPLKSGDVLDLTTFREESDYIDGRRPSHVTASTPLKDAQRRDFTVNALFWDDENQKLIDEVGGLDDLVHQKLRCVGDAATRFDEDHLRVIRLVRFFGQFPFEIEDSTLKAAFDKVHLVQNVSGERVWSEFKKINQSKAFGKVFGQNLFHKLIFYLFQIDSSKLKFQALRDELDVYFFLSILKNNGAKLSLPFSKQDEQWIELFQIAEKKWITIEDISELSYEIEKKLQLSDVLNYFVKLGRLKSEILQDALTRLRLNPESLINGEGLQDIIPPHQIGVVLKKIRLLQFSGLLTSSVDAQDYLNNQILKKTESKS